MMTLSAVAAHFDKVWEKLRALREAGQKEYAGGTNAFGNFERLGAALQLPREKILWVYLVKHLDGIQAWLNGHKSQREPVTGRIEDAIVYLLLLHAMASETEPADPRLDEWAAHCVKHALSVDFNYAAVWNGETIPSTKAQRAEAWQRAFVVQDGLACRPEEETA